MESGARRCFRDWRFTKLAVTMDYDFIFTLWPIDRNNPLRPIDGSPIQDSTSSWADEAVETEGKDRMARSKNTM